MLTELRIRNLAVVEDLTFSPGPGLNVISGETGAGKSVVVSAIELLLGGRAAPDCVRTGAGEARIDGVFHFDEPGFLRGAGLDLVLPDGCLLLTREVAQTGRSRVLVNDELSTVARLKAIGEALADLHGQHDHQHLLRSETHVDYLDRLGQTLGIRLRESPTSVTPLELYRLTRSEFLDLKSRLRTLEERRTRAFEIGRDLEYAVKEIEAAGLKPGEEESLLAERRQILHAEKLLSAVDRSLEDLSEGEAAVESRLARASQKLAQAAGIDASLSGSARSLEEALVSIQDVTRDLARYRDGLQFEPDRAEWIESRLTIIGRLKKKYGDTEAAILARGDALRRELAGLVDEEALAAALAKDLERAGSAAVAAGLALKAWRAEVARRFEKSVALELQALGMPRARLCVRAEPARLPEDAAHDGQALLEKGLDRVEFFLEANPGEDPRPLVRVASGGELSRVMLALKTVLRAADPLPLLVFDEVDAGIGGRVASAVGERLREISRSRQVLVITHLPMIACQADHHFQVRKSIRGGRTTTTIERLSDRQREEELARMLAGAESGSEAVRAARALLNGARKGTR